MTSLWVYSSIILIRNLPRGYYWSLFRPLLFTAVPCAISTPVVLGGRTAELAIDSPFEPFRGENCPEKMFHCLGLVLAQSRRNIGCGGTPFGALLLV